MLSNNNAQIQFPKFYVLQLYFFGKDPTFFIIFFIFTDGNRAHDNRETEKNDNDEKLIIKFDENTGEAMISEKLYDEDNKKILPIGDLLFCFFRRILLACIYAGVMFIVLILGEKIRDFGKSTSNQHYSGYLGTVHFGHHLRRSSFCPKGFQKYGTKG